MFQEGGTYMYDTSMRVRLVKARMKEIQRQYEKKCLYRLSALCIMLFASLVLSLIHIQMCIRDRYTDAILWAKENGIVAGYDNGTYGVGDTITREQFAAILYRYASLKGYDITQGGMAAKEFLDYEQISDYAKPAVSWAVNAGIISGMGDGTLVPQGKTTRAEAATMLMHFYGAIVES